MTRVDSVEVSTVVYVPPDEVYEFLVDFPRYAKYSRHLKRVERDGDGSIGTRYDLTFTWWILSYTARSEVTALDPPERIDWEITRHIDAHGAWLIEPIPEEAPDNEEYATRVRFLVEFRPGSANRDALDLPLFVSLDWLIEIVKPKIKMEAKRIVRRVVADLEGEQREVELEIHRTPETV